MKKVLILLIVFLNLLVSKDFRDISLSDFVQILSHTTQNNFVISDTVKKDFQIYLPDYHFTNKKQSLKLLFNILKINNLGYKNINNVYLIYKPKPKKIIKKPEKKDPLRSHIIKYNFLTNDDIKSLFSSLYPSVKYSILKGRIFIFSNKQDYLDINNQIKLIDSSYLQHIIHITVVTTQNNANLNKGLDFKALKFSPSSYISLLTSNASFNATLDNPLQLFAVINALHSKGLSNLLLTPSILLSDKKDSLIESTTNIPFLSSTTSTKQNITTVRNSYKYKDVGLKIKFTNVTITKLQINFDLDIYIQSVLDKSKTPTTSSKHIITHIVLKNKSAVFIGGLTSTDKYQSDFNIPIIENIPILGHLTSHKVTDNKNSTFSIIITSN